MRLLQTQESVNPYQSVLAASTTGTTTNSVGDTVDLTPTRAVLLNADISGVTFTFADGTSASITLTKGIYNLAVTKVDTATNILFLY